jgi:aspartate aminotransferase
MITDLSQTMDSLMYPQERYERLADIAYRRSGPDLCDLGYANFHGGPPPAVLEILRDCLEDMRPLDLQYTPYGGAVITRRLIAERLRHSHGLPFGWRNVILTPGAMAALNILFRAIAAEDSSAEVIVPVPCWLDYVLYLNNLGLRPVLAPLSPRTFRLDLNRIAEAISGATRAIVFSQPANPTGAIYSREELCGLADILRTRAGNRILLISDECHRDTVFPGSRFVSPAEFYDNTCIVYSFGKAFRIQGQRTGYIAVSPGIGNQEGVVRNLERLCRATGFCTPTSLMQLAVRGLLSVELDAAPILRRRNMMLEALRAAGYEAAPSEGTYFLYPASPVPDDFQFVEMLAGNGVLTLPASVFHHRGHFRVSLTAPDSHVERAAQTLAAVIGQCRSSRNYVSRRTKAVG